MTKEEMQLVVHAVDEASATMKAIRDEIHQMGSGSSETSKQVETLGQKLGSLANGIKLGFSVGIGQDIFGALKDGFNSLIRLIPDAISAGAAWADTIAQLQRETGMTAEQTSLLAAVMERAGVPVDNMDRLFALLGKNLQSNAKLFKDLGVATVDASGNQLDAYTIVDNLRRKFSEYGASLSETAAGQKLLGRTGYEMLQFLQLNDSQFRLFAQAAAAAGQVLGEDAVQGAERFKREWGDLGGVIQGVQTSVFAALEPTLESFINGFSNFLKQHMQDILQFVVNAANFVMGVIGGLLGIDFGQITLAQQIQDAAGSTDHLAGKQQQLQNALSGAKAGEDALTKSIKAQIDAIDKQIAAIDAREAKRHAASERAKLQAAIDAAQANLGDITGNAPDVVGLSSAEAVLAEQKHDQDILDAKKALSDAVAALTAFDADQTDAAEKAKLEATKTSLQQQLQAHTAAHVGMTGNVTGLAGTTQTGYKAMASSAKSAFATMNSAALEWRDKGVGFANSLRGAIGTVVDALLGSETTIYNIHDQAVRTTRSGGLAGALTTVAGLFSWIADHANNVALGFRTITTAIGLIGPVLSRAMAVINDVLNLNFAQAQQDETALLSAIRSAAGNVAGHAMGGYVPPGGVSRVGEVAAEAIYARPGGGVDVYSNPAAGPSSSGASHGHDIYLDGRKVGEALDQRNFWNARTATTSIRPAGAT